MRQSIKLQTSSILHVPFDKLDKDFTFIVNGKEYQTSKVVADILSTKVSNFHLSDPTVDSMIINTKTQGNFAHFLNLMQFQSETITENDFHFFSEIIEQIGTENIELNIERSELTIDNVISRLQHDESYPCIYSQKVDEEIEFISKNFNEIDKNQRSSLFNLTTNSILSIVRNPNLLIESEDELLNFINELYSKSNEYSILYEYVYFNNVQAKSVEEFIDIFDISDINNSIWQSISNRLKTEIIQTESNQKVRHYKAGKVGKNNRIEVVYKNKEFEGIFKYFRDNSSIQSEVEITSSSVKDGDVKNVVQTDKPTTVFNTDNIKNSWVCFNFLNHKIIPTNYTIRSNYWRSGLEHLRSWIIEGSIDNINWTKVDEVNDDSSLNGINKVHTFSIQNPIQQGFKYLRIHQTRNNWSNSDYLCFNCIEFYGFIE